MLESQPWRWNEVIGESEKYWLDPSRESYYFLHRWKNMGFKTMLDLGCGLGRHSIMFASAGFDVTAFDISQEALERTGQWAKKEGFNVECVQGDMLSLPFKDNTFDCLISMNVISHTDSEGIKQTLKEMARVLKDNGECYFTLCSKNTWGFIHGDWPMPDPNTKICMTPGPEYGIPHYFADYSDISDIMVGYEIIKIEHIESFSESFGEGHSSFHYHIHARKKGA